MKKESRRSKSPWFQKKHLESGDPAHASGRKKKEQGVPTAVEERIKQSHKRLANAASKLNKQSGTKSGKHKPHFVPPPARTSPGNKKTIAWEGNTHRLEIDSSNLTSTRRSLRVDELDTSEVYRTTYLYFFRSRQGRRNEERAGEALLKGTNKIFTLLVLLLLMHLKMNCWLK